MTFIPQAETLVFLTVCFEMCVCGTRRRQLVTGATVINVIVFRVILSILHQSLMKFVRIIVMNGVYENRPRFASSLLILLFSYLVTLRS